MARGPVGVDVLGSLEVHDGSGPILVSGAKQRGLLALLALSVPHPVPTGRLIDEIWRDSPPSNAVNALQAQISQLRRVLGAEVLVRQGPGYALAVEPDDIDAIRMERLVRRGRESAAADDARAAAVHFEAAVALVRGSPLAELLDHEFAREAASRLDELAVSAHEGLIDAELALGQHAGVVGRATELVSAYPFHERFHTQLITALYRGGRQTDALRAVRAYREVLAEELGLEPGPELRRLESAVLMQDPELDAPVAVPAPGPLLALAPEGRRTRPPHLIAACVGRSAELAALRGLVEHHRLVTLVGPGGVGKTRLAIEVANAVGDLASEAVMVELATVSDADRVEAAIAAAFGIEDVSGEGLDRTLQVIDRENGPVLIVVDNCEHVGDEAARVTDVLLRRGPAVRVLATSRQGLGVPGESLFLVPPMDEASGVELFVERAVAAAPGLVCAEAERLHIARMCAHLDGMPLAIELAAARVGSMSVLEVASRLGDRFRLLDAGVRFAPARQQTLRAVIDWSYDLLDDPERIVFERLAVMVGGATAASAEAVCGGDGVLADDVIDVLGRLVGKSLVNVDRGRTATRYSMLSTIAEYGRARLVERDELDEATRRLVRWVVDLAERADDGLYGIGRGSLMVEIGDELANVAHALTWCRAHEVSTAVDVGGRLGWYWDASGRLDLAWRALGPDIDDPALPPAVRARACKTAAFLMARFGPADELDEAARLADVGVEAARATGSSRLLGIASHTRAHVHLCRGEFDATRALAQAAVEAFERADAENSGWGAANARVLAGICASITGDLEEAELLVRAGLAGLTEMGEPWGMLFPLQCLADLAERRDDMAAVIAAATSALTWAAALPTTVRTPRTLLIAQLARAEAGLGNAARARSLAEVALVEARERGDHHLVAGVLLTRARAWFAAGELADAEADALAALATAQGPSSGDGAESLTNTPHEALTLYARPDFVVQACLLLTSIALAGGDTETAGRHARTAFGAAVGTVDPATLAAATAVLASALAAGGDPRTAAQALGVADRCRDITFGTWRWDRDARREAHRRCSAELGASAFDELYRTGRDLGPADLLGMI